MTDDHDYKPYLDAVKQGFLKESDIDVAVTRLYTARMKLGMFDPPEMVPYSKIDEKLLDSAEHRAMARKIADESMVLLKNDGVLPLKTSGIKIAVVGPLAGQTKVLLGNYNGIPSHTVSILEGIRAEFPKATINYVAGTQFLGHDAAPVPAGLLTTGGKPGVKASYAKLDMSNMNRPKVPAPVATRIEAEVDAAAAPFPSEAAEAKPLVVRYETTLTPQEAGDYNIGLAANGTFRMKLDGKDVVSGWDGHVSEPKLGRVHLEAGKPVVLQIDYVPGERNDPAAKLVWSKVDLRPNPAAVAAAKDADVVIAVVGITSELEGEEMQVHEEGFSGGDRTSLDLPKPEQDLLEAETLSGRNNPAGRLPVTFYTDVSQLPPFESYAMKGRTYRYFEGTPLYPFGYGLSYTKFSYGVLSGPADAIKAGDPAGFDVTVTNTGSRAGDEVAELYLEFPKVPGAPLRALRGFQRVHLDARASQKVHFELQPRDLSMVTEDGEPIVAEGSYTVSVGGGQPHSGAPVVNTIFSIKGQLTLPE